MNSIHLPIPSGWKYPIELDHTSPEENKVILESGFNVFTFSRSESAGVNNAREKKRIAAEYDAKSKKHEQEKEALLQEWSGKFQQIEQTTKEERNQMETQMKEREKAFLKQIEQANTKAEIANEAKQKIELLANSIRQSETKHIEEAIQSARNADAAELLTLLTERDKFREELRIFTIQASQEKAKQVEQSMLDTQAKIEKAIEKERREFEKERKELKQSLEKQKEELSTERERLHALQIRQSGSATKGQDNEKDFEQIVKHAFGHAPDFKLFPKKYNSGDFNFLWEANKVMIEVKKGYENKAALRGKGGLAKTKDDFLRNSEFHILLFISEDGEIPDHEKPGDIDFGTVDGRPVIYLGNFNQHDNKVAYLQYMILPLMRSLLQMYSQTDSNKADKEEVLQSKLNTIQTLVLRFQSKLKDINKEILAVKRNIDTGFDRLKAQYNSTNADFEYMLKMATEQGYEKEEKAEKTEKAEVDSVAQPAKKKQRLSVLQETPTECKKGRWTLEEEKRLNEALVKFDKTTKQTKIAEYIGTRNADQVSDKLRTFRQK